MGYRVEQHGEMPCIICGESVRFDYIYRVGGLLHEVKQNPDEYWCDFERDCTCRWTFEEEERMRDEACSGAWDTE